jgi:sigma-B regulation protein RsbU (phosphoserine phosphatase)
VEPLSFYDRRHGPALGLFEKSSYPVGQCAVTGNDLIVLFTDGLYEVEGPSQEEFGLERLLEATRRRANLPALQLFDEVLAETRQFAGGREFQDDVCLVGMEIARSD